MLDLPWRYTTKTESLFVFRADRPNSRNHSIYVQAVDNEGKADPIPAMANFLAIDPGVPDVSICMASSVTRYSSVLDTLVPPGTCVETGVEGDTLPQYNVEFPGEPIAITLGWEGDDADGEVTGWRYRLDAKGEVVLPADVTSTTFTYDHDNAQASDVWIGLHEFRLVAVDDANARSSEKTARFVINYDPNTIIDSVWTYRDKVDNLSSETDTLPEKLIYAKEWRETGQVPEGYDRVCYHFGQLRLKFHGTDRDMDPGGWPPEWFKWSISGTLLKSDWTWKRCPQSDTIYYYCALTDPSLEGPYLDSDSPFRLYVTARDSIDVDAHGNIIGKADGSPDTIWFDVDVPPHLISLRDTVLDEESGTVKFMWEAEDPDEGYHWGPTDVDQAMMLYRYKIDNGHWTDDGLRRDRDHRLYKEVTVEGLEPGLHTFELHAYNGPYLQTRSDTLKIDFEF
jgi:hypothetical protein